MAQSSARPEWLVAALAAERGRDVSAGELLVSADAAWRAGALRVSYRRRATCGVCGGAGGLGRVSCSDCGGSGARLIRTMLGVQRVACGGCGGSGARHARACGTCGGSGAVAEDASAAIFVSPGLRGGDAVRVLGAGDGARGSIGAGMLVARLRDAFVDFPHLARCTPALPVCATHDPTGERLASHLHARVAVSLREALLGFERVLPHPGGAVMVRAAGVTQPGQALVFASRGLPLRVPFFDARTLRDDAGARIEVQSEDELAQDGDALSVAAAAAAAAPSNMICALLPVMLRRPLSPLLGAAAACDGSSAPAAYGDLLITVDVRLPRELRAEQRDALRDAFAAT